MERIAESGACKESGVDGNLATSHQSLTQSERDVGFDRDGRLQRYVKSQQDSGMFFRIIAHAGMKLQRLPFTCREDDTHTVSLRYQLALSCLVEEIHTHRRC